MEIINNLLPQIGHFRIQGYWLVLLASLLESLVLVGVIVPGAVLVVFAGALAAQGYFDLGDLIWFAAVGAVLGDGISFLLGQHGTGLFKETNKVLKASYLEAGEQFFRKHGAKSIFLGRFIGLVRAVIPFVAGLSGMAAKRFYLWNILSAFAWAASHLLAGYFLGQAWQMVEVWTSRAGIFLTALILVLFCANLLKRFIVKQGGQLLNLCRSLWLSVTQALITNPDVARLIARYPRFFSFANARLDRARFSGLPLTLLGIAFLYTLLLLGGIIEDMLALDPIVAVDTRLDNLLYFYRAEMLVKGFLWITLLGKAKVVLSVATLFTVLFWIRKNREFILPFWLTLAGSGVFSLLGKLAFHRQRPLGISVFTEASFSFPSGHATIAAAFYGFIVYYLWRQAQNWNIRLNLLFGGSALILAIGFSRLYLGVHFLSDVLGGYLLGFLWLILGICMVERHLFARSGMQAPECSSFSVRLTSAALILVELIFYIHSGLHYNPTRNSVENLGATKSVSMDVVSGFDRYRLPRFTESISGKQQEPLNIIIVARDDASLVSAFKVAGWQPADPVTIGTVARTVKALLGTESYPTAPLTPSFWNGSINDFGFEKPTPVHTMLQRHQVRLWKTDLVTTGKSCVFIGTISLNAGLKWGLMHKMKPDIDSERDALLNDLLLGGRVTAYYKNRFVAPLSGRNFAGDIFSTDGYICVVIIDY
ncbi:LssY C-terminal domain-containing protein [Geobacter argillaceus]|uniref:Undecaprenyl-diphosphatase n=1 Tax=Geobacter argillaceus TaxID=345631 RepID=A0A562WQ09_9BACT|nr:LssY C-terminal domain-containing protein [Geobacter argillaceus]TWJ32389.1 undecaprenyl-diphosphatase [Geobacter argillaceus]